MKIIRFFIFLLYSSQFTATEKCYPCECLSSDIYGMYDSARFKWRLNQRVYAVRCWSYNRKVTEVPSDAEHWIKVIAMYEHPIAKNRVLKRSTFERFTKLEILILSYTSATSIDKDFFYPQRASLREVKMKEDNYRFIPVGLVQYAPLLENVNFENNGIIIVYKGTFTDLRNLKWISLADNKIRTLEIGALRNLPALEFVEFYNNFLQFVDPRAFDIKPEVYKASLTRFDRNPWFCIEKLCPFMHLAKPGITCKEPINLHKKTFADALKYIGIRPHQRRYIVDEFDKSVTMVCSACTYTKLKWQKWGTEAIGQGGVPAGCEILQADGTQTSQLVIAQPKYEHNGNYSCYNPDCIASDCPIPIIAFIVRIAEPKWNFTSHEAGLDEVVRYGSTGLFYILLPILIYSIVMAVAMSAYYIYVEIKRNALQQQP